MFRLFIFLVVVIPTAFFLNPVGNITTALVFVATVIWKKGHLYFAFRAIKSVLIVFVFSRLFTCLYVIMFGVDFFIYFVGGPDSSLLWSQVCVQEYMGHGQVTRVRRYILNYTSLVLVPKGLYSVLVWSLCEALIRFNKRWLVFKEPPLAIQRRGLFREVKRASQRHVIAESIPFSAYPGRNPVASGLVISLLYFWYLLINKSIDYWVISAEVREACFQYKQDLFLVKEYLVDHLASPKAINYIDDRLLQQDVEISNLVWEHFLGWVSTGESIILPAFPALLKAAECY